MRVVLDNVANGTEVITYFNSKVAAFWVRSGTADMVHDGDVICSFVVSDRNVCDGLRIGAEIKFVATADNTTVVVEDG